MSSKKLLTLFFDYASPPSRAVMSFLKLAQVKNVQYKQIRISKNEHMTPEFGQISPYRTLPTITEQGQNEEDIFKLCESHAIMRYISLSRPDEVEDHFYPRQDLKARALVDQYLDWHHTNLREGAVRLVFKKYFAKLRNLEREFSENEIEDTERILYQSLNQLESNLKEQNYLCSDEKYSIADIVATSDLNQLKFLFKFDKYLSYYPRIQEWHAKMNEQSEIQETHKDGQGGISNEFLEMGLDPAAYEALEKDFQEVLQELVGDQSMERFRNEYEKLHRALKTSYESEKRLVKRCKELNDTILQNATRVKTAIKLTQDDANTIAILRKEVDKAWKLVEQAKEKEEKARKIISDLRNEIAHLNKIVEQGSGLSIGQDNTVHNLMRQKDELKKECEQKQDTINDLDSEKSSLQEKIKKLENDLIRQNDDIERHKHELEKLKDDKSREERKNITQNEENKSLQVKIQERDDEIKKQTEEKQKKEQEIQNLNKNQQQLESQIQKLKEDKFEITSEKKKLEGHAQQLEKERTMFFQKSNELDLSLNESRNKLKELEKENKQLKRENSTLLNDKDRMAREKMEALNEKGITKAGVYALTREIEYLRKQVEQDKASIVTLIRDRDMMKKNISKAEEDNQKNKDEIHKYKNEVASLKEKEKRNKQLMEEEQVQIRQLEKERDKFSHEASKANANLMQMVEEVKLKKNLISELKKENIEFEGKLKQQQNLYEAVRSDRNLYSKNLIEAQDEVAELKRKFKIASHQISQLKDEIEAKDQALTNEHHDLAIARKDADTVKANLEKEKKAHEEAKQIKIKLENEIQKLTHIIKEAQQEHEKLKKDYQEVINQRDILGTQLIRRNDELALLYEKIKILQSTLAKGEVQYQERVEDIRLLKFKIADLKSELRIVKSQNSQIGDLRKEVYNLQQQLLTERLQVKALSEELENPLNYHRWRKLEGTDPDTWEMLQKIQTLQKRLIKKTEEVVEKDVVIQEKEKLYVELKNLLARQPGPEVAEQLSIYQQNLKEKTRQMKAMASELNMYQAQVNEYKYEIERLTRELQDMKRKYYEQKRREQMQREAQNKLEPKTIKQNTQPVQRFTGGGFNLAV